jgi:D-sedoheptulose 7-phosphate isomerase
MKYFKELTNVVSGIEVTPNEGQGLSLDEAVVRIAGFIARCRTGKNKVICIGNGGSAAIANHTITDLLKNAKIPAMAFSDASLLTCLSNDLGYESVFQKPMEFFAQKNDIVLAISSSGKSKNILNAALTAKNKGCFLVTLSGFKKDNPLRQLGDMNFYVPSNSYGYVELSHAIICHCITDYLIEPKKEAK